MELESKYVTVHAPVAQEARIEYRIEAEAGPHAQSPSIISEVRAS